MRCCTHLFATLLLCCSALQAQNISAIDFDGEDDYVTMGANSLFDITNNITLEAWVKVDEDQFNDFNRIIDKFNVVDQQGYNLIVNSGSLFMEIFTPSGDSYNVFGSFIADGQWHHVAGAFSTNEIRIYIDGVLDDMEEFGEQTIAPSSNELGIGNNFDGQEFLPLHGQIDEVRIWNVVRTEEELSTFKDQCLTGMEPGLVGYWRFDENTGLVAEDLTPNGSDGTLGNGATWTTVGLPVLDCTFCPELTLEAALSNISCFGECNVSIEILDVVGGVMPFTYIWNDGSALSSIGNLCAGMYSVTVTDADGCSVNETYEIFQPEELIANASATDETAFGANDGTATAAPTGGIEPYEFAWSNGSTDPMISGLIPGSYTVIVTDANFCADTQTVVVNGFGCTLGLMSDIVNNPCFADCDGSITIIPVNAVPPVSYLWGNGSMDPSLSGLCAGSYGVTVSDATGCMVTDFLPVMQPTVLLLNAGSTNETAEGANDGTAWVAPTGGTPPYTYAWTNGSTDSLITGLAPGAYGVIVTDNNGCVDMEAVVVNAFSCISNIQSVMIPTSCFGVCDGAVGITVLDGDGPFTYAWSTGDTTADVVDLCAGSYGVTVTDIGQGCSGNASVTVEEPAPVVTVVDEIIHITDSTSSSVSVTTTGGTPPYTYAWTGPDGFSSESEDIAGMDAGVYSLLVIDVFGCSTILDSIIVLDATVGISDIAKLDVRVYPNPSTGLVHIEVLETTEFTIQLRSLDGRIVETWETINVIDVSAFSPGIYELRVASDKRQGSHRLVIMK